MDMLRAAQNFAVIVLFIIIVIGLCLYFGGLLFIGISYGPKYLTPDVVQTGKPISFLLQNLQYWFAHRSQFHLETNHYYMAKLLGSASFPFLLALTLCIVFRNELAGWQPIKPKESLHGDAKWADEAAIRKAGLRSKTGMLVGKDRNGLLIAGGYQHALLFAPTGSGKGVGFVIPNLLFWTDSVVVHDIKLENYELTSGYRSTKLKQQVFVWNPAQPDGLTHCYNPLDWISPKPGQMVDDVQKIGNLILPEQEFWQNEARSLFVGVVLYLCAVPEKCTSFGEVVRTMRSDDVVYNLAVVLDTIGRHIHPVSYMNLAAFLQKADKERSGVISTLNSSLELWANPLIDTATATSDFNIAQFKKIPTTVYVGLTPDNLSRLKPLMQVFYQQATQFLCQHMPRPDEKFGVLFMMDEFPTLGKMEQFQSGIAYFRGYKVRLFLIIQDTEQLKGIYEESGMNSFLSNATFRVTFAANNVETANLISQLVGNKTVEQVSYNRPRFFDLNPSTRTVNTSQVQRALLLPQEVIMLPRDEQIILVESSPPIKTQKIKYFDDKMFTRRLLPAIQLPQQEPFDPRKFAAMATGGEAPPAEAAPAPDQQEQPKIENSLPEAPIETASSSPSASFAHDDDEDEDDDFDIDELANLLKTSQEQHEEHPPEESHEEESK